MEEAEERRWNSKPRIARVASLYFNYLNCVQFSWKKYFFPAVYPFDGGGGEG